MALIFVCADYKKRVADAVGFDYGLFKRISIATVTNYTAIWIEFIYEVTGNGVVRGERERY